jgi:uncharacterized membrane protein YfcA
LIGTALLVSAGLWVRNSNLQWQVDAIALTRFALGALFVTPVFLYLLIALGRISVRDFAKSITPSVLAAMSVFASVWYPARILAETKPLFQLGVITLIGASCGIATLLFLDKQLRNALFALLQRRARNLAASLQVG